MKYYITLTLKLDKDITRKIQTNIPHEYICKNPQPKISKPNSATYKKDNTQ